MINFYFSNNRTQVIKQSKNQGAINDLKESNIRGL